MTDATISLREHFDALRAADKLAIEAALGSAKQAVELAERQAEKWRANANEWRAAMTDREARFVPLAAHEAVMARLTALEQWRAKAVGAAAVLTIVAGTVGAALMQALSGTT